MHNPSPSRVRTRSAKSQSSLVEEYRRALPKRLSGAKSSALSNRKSILLVEQLRVVGELLTGFVEEQTKNYQVIGQATSAHEAIQVCQQLCPDIVVLDPFLGGIAPVDLVKEILSLCPESRILIFARSNCSEMATELIACGVHGIISQQHSLSVLTTALDIIANSGRYFDEVTDSFSYQNRHRPSLTLREKSVLRLVAEGLSTKEISTNLGISVKTADKFRQRIMQKLDLHDAVHLTRYAITHGLCAL